MKSIYSSVILMFMLVSTGLAQTPDLVNYQAIVRGTTGQVVANQAVGIKISILEGSSTGPAVFSETHTPTTNSYGLVNLQIGNGVNLGPSLSTIDWSADDYFVSIEIDPTGGTTYVINTISQLIAVPYALHARTVEQNDDADADPTNEYTTGIVLNGTDLEVTDGGGTITTDLSTLVDDADPDPTNEIQTITKVGNIITLSSGGAVTDDVNDADANPTNELNTGISFAGNNLTITDAGGNQTVSLASLADADGSITNETNTSVTFVGTTLSITDPAGTLNVDLSALEDDADASPTNEKITSLGFAGTTLTVNEGGTPYTVSLATLADADGSTTNEKINSVSFAGTTLTVSEGAFNYNVSLAALADGDGSATNEMNTGVTLVGTTLNVIDGGSTQSVDLGPLIGDDADADPLNEMNTGVTLVGTMLNVIDGGSTQSVDLSAIAGGDDADADPTNEMNTGVTLVGTTLNVIDGGSTQSVDLSSLAGGDDADADPTNEMNTGVTLVGTMLNVIDGGSTQSVDLASLAGGGTSYKVGQKFGGGVIVFVDSTGQHGLIAALADVAGTYAFDINSDAVLVASSFTDGSANTAALVAIPGEYPAAEAANSFVSGGFTDWYLPSVFELDIMYRANYVIALYGTPMTITSIYWSSTETGSGLQAFRMASTGLLNVNQPSPNLFLVRPMRSF